MSTSTLIAIIVPAAVVLIALGLGLWLLWRRRHLQQRFGPEYDRAVQDEGGRLAAERELRAREGEHDDLEIKALPAERRQWFADEWSSVQARFVDRPEGAVAQADELVQRLMQERGYPTADFDGRIRNLSVDHGRTLSHYRDAHDVKVRSGRGESTTEELRGAMVHYRALFQELLTEEK